MRFFQTAFQIVGHSSALTNHIKTENKEKKKKKKIKYNIVFCSVRETREIYFLIVASDDLLQRKIEM